MFNSRRGGSNLKQLPPLELGAYHESSNQMPITANPKHSGE